MTAKEYENEIFDEDQDPTAELEMLPSGFLEHGADYVELETEAKTTGLEEQVGSPGGTGADHESTRHRDSGTKNIESIQCELDALRVEAATLATRVRSGEARIERLVQQLETANQNAHKMTQTLEQHDRAIELLKSKSHANENLSGAPNTGAAQETHRNSGSAGEGRASNPLRVLSRSVSKYLPSRGRATEADDIGDEAPTVHASNTGTSTPAADTPENLEVGALIQMGCATERRERIRTGSLSVGSGADNDIRIKSKFVSRHHAQIVSTETQSVLTDLNSINGSYVNGTRVERHILQDGDTITMGKHIFKFVKQRSGNGGDPSATGSPVTAPDEPEPITASESSEQERR